MVFPLIVHGVTALVGVPAVVVIHLVMVFPLIIGSVL